MAARTTARERVRAADLDVLRDLCGPSRGWRSASTVAARLGRDRGGVLGSLGALRGAGLAVRESQRGGEALWRPSELGWRLATIDDGAEG